MAKEKKAVPKSSVVSKIKKWAINDPKISIPTAIALCVVIALGIYSAVNFYLAPKAGDEVTEVPMAEIQTITATNTIDGLIGDSTAFKIAAAPETEIESIKRSLVMNPEVPYQVKAISAGEFELTLAAPLAKGALLSIAYQSPAGPTSQAFQVAGQLKLVSSYPADQAVAVPQNSGIEWTFNEAIDANIASFITIEPALETEARIEGNKLILLSKSGFSKDTQYTITLEKGYTSAIGGSLANPVTRRFFTGTQSAYEFKTIKTFNLFQDNEPLHLAIESYMPATEYAVKVFPLEGIEGLQEQVKQYNALEKQYIQPEKHLTTTAVTAIHDLQITPFLAGEYSGIRYLELPQLPIGAYRVECTSSVGNQISFIQVSPYALYTEYDQTLNQHLIWLLNASTSEPINATCHQANQLDTSLAGSDKDGVIRFSPDNKDEDLIIKAPQGNLWIPALGFSDGDLYTPYYSDGWQQYPSDSNINEPAEFTVNTTMQAPMKFLYTDREVYLPGESVQMFGILNTLQKNDISHIYLRLRSDIGTSEVQRVSLNSVGGFSVAFDSNTIGAFLGSRTIEIGSDKGWLGSTSFNVNQFEKPEISISLKSVKPFYAPGEQIELTGSVEHVDGSPMKGYALSLQAYSLQIDTEKATFQTNELGEFQVAFDPVFNPVIHASAPQFVNVSISNVGTENVDISASTGVVIFPSQIILDSKISDEKSKNTASFLVTGNTLKLPQELGDLYNIDLYKGNALDIACEYTLEESYSEAIAVGKTYDPIFKVEVPKYEYKYHSNIVDSGTLNLVNGNGTYNFSPIAGRTYILRTKAQNDNGQWVHADAFYYDADSTPGLPTNPESDPATSQDPLLEAKKHLLSNPEWMPTMPNLLEFEPDAPFELTLKIPNPLKAITNEKQAKTLFIRYGHNYLRHQMQTGLEPTYKDAVSEQELPSGMVKAVFYDGYRFQNSSYGDLTLLKISPTSKKLDIVIETDKKQYTPGSSVSANVKLTWNGKPVEGMVWLSVVDRAYFELYPEMRDAHAEYYAPHYQTGVTRSFHTTDSILLNAMAEMGEGGADGGVIRDDFKTTAHAQYLQTDKDGLATFAFNLPENITSWRLTAHASTENGLLGTNRLTIPSTLPFYLRILSANVFTIKDLPTILVSGRSSSVIEAPQDASIQYEWLLSLADNTERTGSLSAPLFQSGEISIGTLIKGIHHLTVKGQGPSQPAEQDSIKIPLEVVNSRVTFPATTRTSLDKDGIWQSEASNQPARLILWHKAAKELRMALSSLTYADPRRLEQYLASHIANAYLRSEALEPAIAKDTLDPFSAGFYKPLVNAEPSAELTADIVALMPEYHQSQDTLLAHLSRLQDTGEDLDETLAILRIKATLKQPVLYTLHQLSKQQLTANQRLSLAWAFISIGDLEMAKSQWNLLLEALAMNASDPVRLQYMRAIVSEALHLENTENLYQQALDLTPTSHTYQLLQLYYLLHLNQQMTPVEADLQIVDSSTQKQELQKIVLADFEGHTLDIKSGSVVKLDNVSDAIDIEYAFEGNLENVNFDLEGYSMKRTFDKTRIGIDEVINVTVEVTKPSSSYFKLVETIPAGFNARSEHGYISNNQLIFSSYTNENKQIFKYILKPRMSGKFSCEPNVLEANLNQDSDIKAYKKGLEITLEVTP